MGSRWFQRPVLTQGGYWFLLSYVNARFVEFRKTVAVRDRPGTYWEANGLTCRLCGAVASRHHCSTLDLAMWLERHR